MALILQKGIPVRDKVRKYLKYLGYQKRTAAGGGGNLEKYE